MKRKWIPAGKFVLFCLIMMLLMVNSSAVAEESLTDHPNSLQDGYGLLKTLSQDQLQKVNGDIELLYHLFNEASDGEVRLIVGFRTEIPAGSLEKGDKPRISIPEGQEKIKLALSKESISFGHVKEFQHIPFIALSVNQAGYLELLKNEDVLTIEEDALSAPTLMDSTGIINANDMWSEGYDGSGVAVAILDTGVDKNHEMLSGKVISEACYSSNYGDTSTSICPGGVETSTASGSALPYSGTCPTGECDHGTHVAGIAAGLNGSSNGYDFDGTAKGSDIIAVQVFSRFDSEDDCGVGYAPCALTWNSDTILGLERVLALSSTYDIAAINLSLGGGYYDSVSECDAYNSSYKAAVDNLRAAGIATIASSGNSSYTDGMGRPACVSSVISVGATDKFDSVASYSNSADFLDLLAPGSHILSSVPDNGYSYYYGTSMAAPHVTGAWALIRDAHPEWSVSEIRDALINTGVSVLDSRNSITKPRIDVLAAAGFEPQPFSCSTQLSIPEAECNALVELYNSTGGSGWTIKTGWLEDANPCYWYGINCSEGSVDSIDLSGNMLTGSIPESIGSFPNLYYLDLSINMLSGTVPTEVGDLTGLGYLIFWANYLSGAIPSSIGNLSNLEYMDLDENEFVGSIPSEFGNLTNLDTLWLSRNQISGNVPAEFGNMVSLRSLYLFETNLTGRLPEEMTSIPLDILDFELTNICEPAVEPWLTWLESIAYTPSGLVCPAIANQLSPAGKIFDTMPDFTWEEDEGAEEYRFYLSGVEGNLVNTWLAEGDICTDGTCTYNPALELDFGNYIWLLQTQSVSEAGPWSDEMDFEVSDYLPLAPNGVISDVRPEYTWDEIPGTYIHRLFVSHAAVGTVFNDWVEADCTAGVCSTILDVHLQTGNQSWAFQSKSPDGSINEWSQYIWFRVFNSTPPDEAIVPVSPISKAVVGINPTFTWNEVDRASWYKVFIGSDETGKVYNAYHRAAEVCYGTVCEITPTEYLLSGSPVSSLAYGTEHDWYVMPVNVMGNGTWSAAQSFVTEADPEMEE